MMSELFHQRKYNQPNGRPTIGVLAGWQFYRTATNLSYLMPIFRGIDRAAQDLHCNLLLGCGMGASASMDDPLRPAWPVLSSEVDFVPINESSTDGLIVFPPLHSAARSRYVQGLIEAKHPVLLVGTGEQGPTLAADNRDGVAKAMAHLVQHGHRRIAFIAGNTDDISGDSGERLDAYRQSLEAHSLNMDPNLTAFGHHVYSGGYAAMQQIIASGRTFTAVLASNDEIALGAMQALWETGRQVPGDVAVIGFDNRPEGVSSRPSLSTIHIPLFNMGYQAVEHLVRHIEGTAPLPAIIRVETRFVARESCGCSDQPSHLDSRRIPDSVMKAGNSTWRLMLIDLIADSVIIQAQSLETSECQSCCQRLVDSFVRGVEQQEQTLFLQDLEAILQQTIAANDDPAIWQSAVSLIGLALRKLPDFNKDALLVLSDLIDQTRVVISAHIRRQQHEYISEQRWITSRLSFLTEGLLSALDETQVYDTLARHLPAMNVQRGLIIRFESGGVGAGGWSSARNAISPQHATIRFRSDSFPLGQLFSSPDPLRLIMIPITDQTGQIGYAVFDSAHIDLCGAVVQQLGGALNTAHLYWQANESRHQAEEANRMKSRFLSTISHELRTPLNLIVGLSEMVLRASETGDTPLPETTYRDINHIHTYVQHLGGLIGDVLDLATSDAGKLRLNYDFIDLEQTLRLVAESGYQLAAAKGLSWAVDIPETGPWLWADRTRVRQVALNLINNAVKFTEQGSISLKIRLDTDSATVLVSDTGLGVAPDEQAVIFDEFRQSQRSVSLGYGGIGLGLAISKRLVEMHGGSIGVLPNQEFGRGSIFFFTLPLTKAAANVQSGREIFTTHCPPVANPLMQPVQNRPGIPDAFGLASEFTPHGQGSDSNLTRCTILVVDDDPGTRDMYARIVQLQSVANHILTAGSGRNALAILQRELIDLVVLDLQMPDLDGFSVLEAMRDNKATRAIPVIVVTGTILNEAEMARLNRGVATVLEKGMFSIDETVAHISATLEHQRRLSNEAQRLVRKAMAFIHEHVSEPISRREIAKHIHITENHLTFCFRQELGITPIEYVQRYRVNLAKQMLKDDERAIKNIAFDVGFSDSGYFSRIFKRITGVSPETFRRTS